MSNKHLKHRMYKTRMLTTLLSTPMKTFAPSVSSISATDNQHLSSCSGQRQSHPEHLLPLTLHASHPCIQTALVPKWSQDVTISHHLQWCNYNLSPCQPELLFSIGSFHFYMRLSVVSSNTHSDNNLSKFKISNHSLAQSSPCIYYFVIPISQHSSDWWNQYSIRSSDHFSGNFQQKYRKTHRLKIARLIETEKLFSNMFSFYRAGNWSSRISDDLQRLSSL